MDEGAAPWTHVTPPRPADRRRIPSTDGCHLGPEGNIFISDGYINSRVAKYDKNGDWVKQWGEPGKGPGEFNTPHSIAADAKGNIYVADRGNRRIQVFDPDGNYCAKSKSTSRAPADAQPWMGSSPNRGRPTKRCSPAPLGPSASRPGPTQYLYSSDAFPGRIYKLSLDGKVLGCLAARTAAKAVRLDPRTGMPFGKRNLCRRTAQLADTEADFASAEIGS